MQRKLTLLPLIPMNNHQTCDQLHLQVPIKQIPRKGRSLLVGIRRYHFTQQCIQQTSMIQELQRW